MCDYVPFVIEANVYGLAVFDRFAVPDAALVLFQCGNFRETAFRDPGSRFTLGKAVCPGDWCTRIIAFGRLHSGIVGRRRREIRRKN